MSHHERNDGSGYLEGLARDEIHPFARITAVSDVYDALTSNRPYAERKRHIAALAEIREARHLFDRQAVDTLIDVVLRNERLIDLYNQDKVPVNLADVEEMAS
jgi:HD-GYP domain-containing protein (c-di-GMP phosphodiesterase class II)